MQDRSQTTKHETQSSNPLAELEHLSGRSSTLRRLIRVGGPLTAKAYIESNWVSKSDIPEEFDPEDQEIINALDDLQEMIKTKRK